MLVSVDAVVGAFPMVSKMGTYVDLLLECYDARESMPKFNNKLPYLFIQ